MVTKEILIQYSDLQEEIKEVRKKIEWLEDAIPKIEKRIAEIEAGVRYDNYCNRWPKCGR